MPQPISDAFVRCKNTHGRSRDLSISEFELLVSQCLSETIIGGVLIVVDAVNEAAGSEDLIEYLGKLVQMPHGNISTVVTSTLQSRSAHRGCNILPLSILDQEHSDIETFIRNRIANMAKPNYNPVYKETR